MIGPQKNTERAGGMAPALWLTAIGLVVVVAIPFLFVVLLAIFPLLGRGELTAPFSSILPTLADPSLIRLTLNTVLLGISVACARWGLDADRARRRCTL